MINIQDRVIEVLSKSHLMSLAIQDNEGPWIADVIFVYDEDLNIYWMSDSDTRHSKAVVENGKVAGTITHTTRSKEPNFGIQFEGKAEKLPGTQFELLVKHLAKRGYPVPKMSQAKKILDGDRWYKLVPTKMFLIDEENFGFKRQKVEV